MPTARWIRIAIVVIVALGALFAIRLHVASGQDERGNVAAGRRLAAAWCAECHAVDGATAPRQGNPAPDFTAIARRQGTTALALRAFLQSEHKTMPHFIIQPADADNIVAYILSLQSR